MAIFTADDFGFSPALNGAVVLAHKQGVLGCASLMAGAPAAGQALALARELPGLCLGVHLTLIKGRAVLPPGRIPRLVDSEGRFPNSPAATGWRYFLRPGLLPAVRQELAAQVEAVLAAGRQVWFLNAHLHLHLHPRLLPVVLDLAREYRIPGLRLAREDWRATLALAPEGAVSKLAQGLIFAWLSRRARRRVEAAGLVFNHHFFGLLQHGRMTEDFLLGLVPRLKPGVTEICCHPALYADTELKRAAPAYRRQEELAALLSSRLKDALVAAHIQVSDFRELSLGREKSRPGSGGKKAADVGGRP
jgi:hopanoid biosynthesis associated protein HpnK